MIILLILRNFFFSVVILFICFFSASGLFDKAISSEKPFIENIYWCLGTVIGIAPAFAIPLLNCFLTH